MGTQADLDVTLRLLQGVAIVIGIVGVVGPLIVGWLFWKAAKEFATKEELNTVMREASDSTDDVGKIVNELKLDKAQQSVKIDIILSRLDKLESEIKVELRYIRRDLDMLISSRQGTREMENS